MKDIIFVCVLIYSDFKGKMSRVVIRDNRDMMKVEVNSIVKMKSDMFVVDCIAEFNFIGGATKYYTVEKFLAS